MVTALAIAVLSVSATLLLLLTLLLAGRGRKSTAQAIKLLPEPLDAFLGRVGRRLVSLWGAWRKESRHERRSAAAHRDNQVGARLRFISLLLPADEKWRLEEMMNHRNELREGGRRLPPFHYLATFAGVCRMRWEAWAHPRRRID
ncbi:hypothetical protein ACIQCD_09910 [Streptomyces sp. NPDC093250]|uniref:hypothetical protein n=1 Tax=unclassified Streptomyces TaxID=2593676 RepID=UPI00340759A1